MLKVILNRLKPQAEEIMAEEQAGFRAGRSSAEQIVNLRIMCEKYLKHQQICTMSSLISKNNQAIWFRQLGEITTYLLYQR